MSQQPSDDQTADDEGSGAAQDQNGGARRHVMVVGPDGQPMGMATIDSDEAGGTGIGEPAKVMRIGTMIKQLLEEVRAAPLDEASRLRLKEIHATSIKELEEGLSPDLREELDRLSLPFSDDTVPSESELRIAQAQLVGWLEGVFHGLQTALFAQQMGARMQLEQMRRGQLPAGGGHGPGEGQSMTGTGQYL